MVRGIFDVMLKGEGELLTFFGGEMSKTVKYLQFTEMTGSLRPDVNSAVRKMKSLVLRCCSIISLLHWMS